MAYNPPIGSIYIYTPLIYHLYTTYILPSGRLYATYHLLGEPETTIEGEKIGTSVCNMTRRRLVVEQSGVSSQKNKQTKTLGFVSFGDLQKKTLLTTMGFLTIKKHHLSGEYVWFILFKAS